MEHWNSITPIYQQQENFDTKLTSPVLQRNSVVTTSSVVSNPYSNLDETMNSLKSSMNKMMTSLERMEQRLNRVEQTTNQILKNQQEVLQAPFISQNELDNARKVAEKFEKDSAVAKQLQAAYNKEIEVRKNMAPRHTQQWQTVQTPMMQVAMNQAGQCPICGGRFAMNVLENHVQQCLDQFSEDPKKEIEIQETKKKMETGFFGRLIKSTKTTEKTKVISQNSPLLGEHEMVVNPNNYYPQSYSYGYPMQQQQQQLGYPMQQQNQQHSNQWSNYDGYPNN